MSISTWEHSETFFLDFAANQFHHPSVFELILREINYFVDFFGHVWSWLKTCKNGDRCVTFADLLLKFFFILNFLWLDLLFWHWLIFWKRSYLLIEVFIFRLNVIVFFAVKSTLKMYIFNIFELQITLSLNNIVLISQIKSLLISLNLNMIIFDWLIWF